MYFTKPATAVVGPGDESTVYFPGTISSLTGHWRGTPPVHVVNAA